MDLLDLSKVFAGLYQRNCWVFPDIPQRAHKLVYFRCVVSDHEEGDFDGFAICF